MLVLNSSQRVALIIIEEAYLKGVVSSGYLADKYKIPKQHIKEVAATLKRKDVLGAFKGRNGGFFLQDSFSWNLYSLLSYFGPISGHRVSAESNFGDRIAKKIYFLIAQIDLEKELEDRLDEDAKS
jgi:hypothetical protein